MFAGLKIAKAWSMLHDPQVVGNLDSKVYMELYRDAGYSEEQVQYAGNSWANMRIDRGLEP